jgi:hypothetical protein
LKPIDFLKNLHAKTNRDEAGEACFFFRAICAVAESEANGYNS